MKKYIIILVLSLFISELAISQDPYFSQYFASPMTLNPSLIGSDLKKESRLQMITRNQWWGGNSKPYTTNMVSLEKRHCGKKQTQPILLEKQILENLF